MAVGLFAGPTELTLTETLSGLFASGDAGTSSTIVWSIRIPRILVGFVTGASLGLAGVLIQLSTRSTFGDPNLFGIGGGAVIFLAATAAGIFVTGEFGLFAGCIVSSMVVGLILSVLVSSKDLSPVKLAIMGIAVGALTVSVGTSVISHGRVFPTQVIGLLAGSFTSSSWVISLYAFPTFAVCFCISLMIAGRFAPIMLGDILAKSLGVNPILMRNVAMSIAGILAGVAVYGGGLIGFIGLLSPHVTRRLFNSSPLHLIVGSSLIGAILALGADQISRLLFAPTELPVGLTTTILGAPVMIYLAFRMK